MQRKYYCQGRSQTFQNEVATMGAQRAEHNSKHHICDVIYCHQLLRTIILLCRKIFKKCMQILNHSPSRYVCYRPRHKHKET